jgi:hypothetical protein
MNIIITPDFGIVWRDHACTVYLSFFDLLLYGTVIFHPADRGKIFNFFFFLKNYYNNNACIIVVKFCV